VTARAVTIRTPSQRLSPDLQAKIVDDAKPLKAQGDLSRIVIGGVSAPAGVSAETRASLERAAQLRREKAERQKKRNQPVKRPLSFEVKEARKEARAREIADAYDAVLIHSRAWKSVHAA
jgi:hypothetical protein